MSVCKKKEPSELQFRNGSSDDVVYSPTSSDSNKKSSSGQSIEYCEPKELKSKFAAKMIAKSLLSSSFERLCNLESKAFQQLDSYDPLTAELTHGYGFSYRAGRVFRCGTFLDFSQGIFETGEIDDTVRLKHANFCKDRLCPMCNWRRGLKIYGNVSQIMNVIGDKYQFLFLTLTVPNCEAEELSSTIDNMNLAFYRMKRSKRFKSVVKGFHRVLEVTINQDNESYHPHFHVILAVEKNYLKSRDYITHSEWLQMWRDATKNQYIQMVNIKVIKPKLKDGKLYEKSLHNAVAEVSKYAVKASDFLGKFDKKGNLIHPYDEEIIDRRVFTLASALSGRQLSVFGGVFSDTQKALKLDDAETGDLVHVQDDNFNPYVAELIVRFKWSYGISRYEKVSCNIVRKEQCKDVS